VAVTKAKKDQEEVKNWVKIHALLTGAE